MAANETVVHANGIGQKIIRLAMSDVNAPDALQLLCKALELPSASVIIKSKQIKSERFLVTCNGSGYMIGNNHTGLDQIKTPELLSKDNPIIKDFARHGSNFMLVAPGETPFHTFALLLGFESETSVFTENDLSLVLTFVEEKVKRWWQGEKEAQTQRSQFFESLLGQLPADIAVFDRNCRYMYLNKNAIKNDEIREWLIGKTDFDYCRLRNRPFDIAQKRKEQIELVVSTGEAISFEETIYNGNIPYTHIRILKPIFNDALPNQLEYVIGYGINISKQKEMEQKTILQSQAMDAAFDGIALLDREGQFTYLNKSMLDMFAYTEQELLGTGWQKLYNPEETARVNQSIFPLLKENGYWNGEATGCDSMGNPVQIEISYTLLENGQMVCICRDIKKRKQQEDELEKLAIVADKSMASVIITDDHGRIEWVNDAFITFTGYRLDEVKGKRPGEFLQGAETDTNTISEIRGCIREGKHFRGELLNYDKQGKPYWVYLDITPVRNNNNETQRFIGVQNDITALKNAEKEIRSALEKERELSDLKSRFISMASHEFRTPLTTIRMGTELIEKHLNKVEGNVFMTEVVNSIYQDISRITDLMNEVLLLGKIEANKYPFNPVASNLELLLRNYLNTTPLLQQKRIVNICTTGTEQAVCLDPKMFTHILDNIVSNAVKYSADGSKIHFTIAYQATQVDITITDEGIGIPKKEIKHLFSSFYRCSNTESVSGTGLGLVIVKHFMDAHKGNIEIQSQQHVGTTVKLTMPY